MQNFLDNPNSSGSNARQGFGRWQETKMMPTYVHNVFERINKNLPTKNQKLHTINICLCTIYIMPNVGVPDNKGVGS
jgi:hypothetical protein